MSKYPGQFCQAVKLSYERLLGSKPLLEIKEDKITNGLILELVRLRNTRRLPWKVIIAWVVQLYGRNWPTNEPAELTLIKTFTTVYQKHRTLMLKRNSDNIEHFCDSQFCVPVPRDQCSIELEQEELPMKQIKRQSLLRREDIQALRMTVTDLCTELKENNKEACVLRHNLSSLQKRVNLRNVRKREKRKTKRLLRQKEGIRTLTAENEELLLVIKKLNNQLQKKEKAAAAKLKRCRETFAKTKMRYKSRLRRVRRAQKPASVDLDGDASDVVSDSEDEHLVTMDKGHYNSKIRECCMQLLAHNVGIHNVETCMKAVFDLVGCKAERLPSKSTLANIMVEAKAIAQLQIADTIPNYDSNMLHSDGTTKFGEKYGGMQISTSESCYTLCLTTMKAGGASDFKELLDSALSDVNDTCQAVTASGSDLSKQILASIKNTMSDRHIVEKKFNELLESYRAEVLPCRCRGRMG